MTSASEHARFDCTADGRHTRKPSRERGLQQCKGHALSVREQCMGKGRVRACASGKRTFRSAGSDVPEGRPTGESNPNASSIERGAAPAVGLDRSGHGCRREARDRRRSTYLRDNEWRTHERSSKSSAPSSALSRRALRHTRKDFRQLAARTQPIITPQH